MSNNNKLNDTKDLNAKSEEVCVDCTKVENLIADEGLNFDKEEANSMPGPFIIGITMIE